MRKKRDVTWGKSTDTDEFIPPLHPSIGRGWEGSWWLAFRSLLTRLKTNPPPRESPPHPSLIKWFAENKQQQRKWMHTGFGNNLTMSRGVKCSKIWLKSVKKIQNNQNASRIVHKSKRNYCNDFFPCICQLRCVHNKDVLVTSWCSGRSCLVCVKP